MGADDQQPDIFKNSAYLPVAHLRYISTCCTPGQREREGVYVRGALAFLRAQVL